MTDAILTDRLLGEAPVRSIDDYVARGGGEALAKALSLPPSEVAAVVKTSGLRGRGGAGFPTGGKWEGALREVELHPDTGIYLCCNAAEGEPATFKDRYLIRRNPYLLLEGITIAAHGCGAPEAYIAIKQSFEPEIERLTGALEEMQRHDLLGGIGMRMVGGPEEYLFGEETGMLEVLEGREPMPRLVPPYIEGLFATRSNPTITVANNVETLCNVVGIVRFGPEWFRALGTESSPGTMVFTLVGDVRRSGMYELPLGTPLRVLIEDLGGGVPEGHTLKAVVPGASHAVLTAAHLDTPLDFDAMRAVGSGLGSAGFTVYDDSACMVRVAHAFSRFLYVESCGQCNPCKLHSGDITSLLEQIDAGDADSRANDEIARLCAIVTDGQRCYLASAEQILIGSILRTFPDEFAEHLGRGCPRPRSIAIPKLTDFDEGAGRFEFDGRQMRKRPDWTYA